MLPREIIAAIADSGRELPPKVRRAALRAGPSLVAALCRVLEDPDRYESRRSTGYGTLHVLSLLRELGATSAAPSVVALLRRAEPMELQYSAAIDTLEAFGDSALEPLLAAPPGDEEFEDARAEAISRIGRHDPRALALLLAGLERNVGLFGGFLGTYGDPAALPALVAAFERTPVRDTGLFAPSDLVELEDAIAELGGELTSAQRAKVTLDTQLARERLLEFAQRDEQDD